MSYGLIFVSMMTLVLQGIAQLLGRWDLRRFTLALLLFIVVGIQFHFYLLHSHLLLRYPVFFLSYVPLLLLLGPLMRLYFLMLSDCVSFKFVPMILHGALPCMGFIYYLQYAVKSPEDLRQILNTLYSGQSLGSFYEISLMVGVSLLFYAGLILKEQPRFRKRDTVMNVPLLMGWAMINIIFVTAMMFCIFSGTFSVTVTHIGNVIVSGVFVGVFLISTRYPTLFQVWLFEVHKERRARKYLGDIDPVETLTRIRTAMEDEALYVDSGLSLETMSIPFDLTRYQLSELLNDYAGMGFHDFVAHYRVEAAKKMLLKDPWKKIISVAGDVGFNSQVTFNKTFKKWTGQTPSEFQKEQR